jgi:hypothetical protein
MSDVNGGGDVRRALLVLSMHRSGTSAMAGLLVRLGVGGPRTLMPPNEANPLGYWESEPIVELHDRLLRAAGTAWHAWTPLDASWDASPAAIPFADELRRLVAAEFGSAPMFVVKDPRMCRLVPFWLRTLEASAITACAILVVRDPVEVSRSLAARDALTSEFSLLMWLRHMLDAEGATRSIPRSVVSYRELLADWRAVVHRMARDLNITWPRSPDEAGETIAQFLKPELCHHALDAHELQAAPPLGSWAINARNALDQLRFGNSAGLAQALATLDEVRRAMDAAGVAFGRGDEAVRSQTFARLAEVDGDRRSLQERLAAVEAARAELRERAAALNAERTRTTALLEEAQRREIRLEAEVARLQQETALLHTAYTALQRTQQQLESELASSRRHVEALLSSGSWRVTAPLRALLRVAKRVTGRDESRATM